MNLQSGSLDLGNGARAVARRQSGRPVFGLIWPDGSFLTVDVFRGHVNATLAPAGAAKGMLTGLYVDFDGDSSNDFLTRAGEHLRGMPNFEQL